MHNVIIIVISSYHDFMIAPFVAVCFLEWNHCNKNNMVSPVTAVKTVTCGHLFMEGWMANGGNWLQSSCAPIYRSEPAHPETGWWLKLQNHSDFLLLTSQTWTVWLKIRFWLWTTAILAKFDVVWIFHFQDQMAMGLNLVTLVSKQLETHGIYGCPSPPNMILFT